MTLASTRLLDLVQTAIRAQGEAIANQTGDESAKGEGENHLFERLPVISLKKAWVLIALGVCVLCFVLYGAMKANEAETTRARQARVTTVHDSIEKRAVMIGMTAEECLAAWGRAAPD